MRHADVLDRARTADQPETVGYVGRRHGRIQRLVT